MKLKKVEITNFRLLKDISGDKAMNVNEKTTVLVGKNNAGKTSFSHIFELFLNRNEKLSLDDFSIQCYQEFEDFYNEYESIKADQDKLEQFFIKIKNLTPAIRLILTIEYSEQDNWNNIRPLLTTLDDSNEIKIIFKYGVENTKKFYDDLSKNMNSKKKKESFIDVLKKIYHKHFIMTVYPYSPYEQYEKVTLNEINKIISTCFIAAQRSVEDSNSNSNSKLSNIFQKEYQVYKKTDIPETDTQLQQLDIVLDKANKKIDSQLLDFFKSFTKSFSTFGYPNIEGLEIVLKSNVTTTNLFNGISLFYKNNKHLLPEKYNGLGYSNLIYIISQIMNFKSKIIENPTDLNIIFIEEPEAHMHPQLQNMFINKLNEFLKTNDINAQVILTTHSSHIVSNGDFETIRYFCKESNTTYIKDLMDFKSGNSEETINFLKQYMTLVKCDMFFADKIILIEGTCERLLMPLFIKKTDDYLKSNKNIKPLSEQYISVIEIGGAYMLKFKELLKFLGVKTLIITDIDSCIEEEVLDEKGQVQTYKNGNPKIKREKHEIKKEKLEKLVSTNATLCSWIPKESSINKLLAKRQKECIEGNIAITYQRKHKMPNDTSMLKCGRTFEEAFIIDNAKYIFDNKESLGSINNNIDEYESTKDILDNSYSIYEYIDKNQKKTEFAFDLLYVNEKQWIVPEYIREGLVWLSKE